MTENGEAQGQGRTLFVVDAMALFFRAHFAFVQRPLTTSQGLPVGALYGFLSTLLALIRDEKAGHLAVALDAPGPTFRHEQYASYKANRPEAPPELALQIPYLQRLIEALGLGTMTQPGVEADDLIASLTRRARELDWEVVVVSADKDFGQLIRPGVRQYVPARGREPARWMDAAQVRERWGVAPEQFVDYLALVGDATDNVPGVTGIGPKTAVELLREHGGLDEILAHVEQIQPASLQRRLREGRAQALASRELVRLRGDLAVEEPGAFSVPDPRSRPQLRQLLRELEFRNIEGRLFAAGESGQQRSLLDAEEPAPPGIRDERPTVPAAEEWKQDYRLLASAGDLARALEARPSASDMLGFSLVTDGEEPQRSALVGIAWGWEPGRIFYLPLAHHQGTNLDRDAVRPLLGPVLADQGIVKAGENLSFALQLLARWEIAAGGPLEDVRVAAYILDPEASLALDGLARKWLDYRGPLGPAPGGGGKGALPAEGAPEAILPAACLEADLVLRLRPKLNAALVDVGGTALYRQVEMPLTPVLAAMMSAGVAVDPRVLTALGETLAAELGRGEEEIYRLAGESFNVNSPKQLQEILFDKLKLRHGQRTKTGFSTSQAVLEELATIHPLPRAVLGYRQLAKLKNTYVDALGPMINPRTGRIHTQFHQTATATGRLSSSNPNLQNIPVRSAMGREVRRAFIAPPGARLLSADYSQIELRVLAHLAEDEYLCAAFRKGADIHRATAARVAGIPEEDVSAEMRGRAKTVNFGVIYGMGPQRLAAELGIPLRDAAGFIEEYFAKLPGVKRYIDGCIAAARTAGYAQTLLGRRRYLPDLHSTHARLRAAAERMALNSTVQGSAADLIKLAMIRLDKALRAHPGARLLLQVHDELLLEVPASRAEAIAQEVRGEMEGILELRVPLRVSVGLGKDWLEAHG